MQEHVVPLYTLKKAKKNGTAKLVQQTLLTVLKNETVIRIEDDNGEAVAILNNAREFANWWNKTLG
ncbi:MAG: hypothetical protein OEZ47_09325 [Gammaproteobacteria bacterium]|nr:hypothetical protein [Gammaproteobacteria bacterium]